MKKILILGAGMSSTSLIKYLLDNSETYDWRVVVGDKSKELAEKKCGRHPNSKAIYFDVFDVEQRKKAIAEADVVVSMLPARMHYLVAVDCVEQGKSMFTASYVSEEIKALHERAKSNFVLLLNEMGVDPGIDHMSAMQVIDRIRESGAGLTAFESATGGLVAPEHDDNPWNYKFTWNPRNVVVAGQGVSRFLHNGRLKYIPYHKLFERTEEIEVKGLGSFEIYPNRDSMKYQNLYGLNGVKTLFRGTIRRTGYSRAWDTFVQLGMTDDTYQVENSEWITYRQFIDSFLPYVKGKSVEEKLADYLQISMDSNCMHKLKWSGIFEPKVIGLKSATPAEILQHLLEPKWKLGDEEKDMIVMRHLFQFEQDDIQKEVVSTLVVKGNNKENTAMSVTVGIPVAIATKLYLTGIIKEKGVHIPIRKNIYQPVMEELKTFGIEFYEEERTIE
jgi:saccharopine dehydrogenase (NADP+, L-glutamate forming)